MRYRRALLEGFQSLKKRPLAARMSEEICSLIKGQTMTVRKISGAALAKSNGEIFYTPPVGEALLRGLLANWE